MDVLISSDQIDRANARLAAQIKEALGPEFTCLALMDGAFVFAADLMRALHDLGVYPRFESLDLSSYGDSRHSSGQVTLSALSSDKAARSLSGQTVLIIDDVLETGRTLETARAAMLARGAADVKICVFAKKPVPKSVAQGEKRIEADFFGWQAPDRFLVGYGLDDAGKFRGQPFISAAD